MSLDIDCNSHGGLNFFERIWLRAPAWLVVRGERSDPTWECGMCYFSHGLKASTSPPLEPTSEALEQPRNPPLPIPPGLVAAHTSGRLRKHFKQLAHSNDIWQQTSNHTPHHWSSGLPCPISTSQGRFCRGSDFCFYRTTDWARLWVKNCQDPIPNRPDG